MKLGTKFDGKKILWNLLPWDEVEEVAKVMTHGAMKYSPMNWQHVANAEERYFAAALRHIVAWKKGEKIDKESGRSHLSHAICCLLFIMWFDKRRKNDTTKKEKDNG